MNSKKICFVFNKLLFLFLVVSCSEKVHNYNSIISTDINKESLNNAINILMENEMFFCFYRYLQESPEPWFIADTVNEKLHEGIVIFNNLNGNGHGSIILNFSVRGELTLRQVVTMFFKAIQIKDYQIQSTLLLEIRAAIFRGYIVYANNREGKDPFPNWQDPNGWDTMLNNNSDVTAFYDVIYTGGQMTSTIRQGLADYIRNTFADEVYNVYHSYDPIIYSQDKLLDIKDSTKFMDNQFTPLLDQFKGGCQ